MTLEFNIDAAQRELDQRSAQGEDVSHLRVNKLGQIVTARRPMTPNEKRMAIERKVVRHLIRTAKKHGYAVTKVNDGEEVVKCKTETEAMDAVFSVDESTIYFKHPDQPKGHCAVIVLGNDGRDAIADCSVGELWDDVIAESNTYSDKLDD